MARKNVRVDLHLGKPDVLVKLLKKVNEKHIALGTDSPLKQFDMTDFDTKLKEAELKRESSKDLRAQSESLMEAANAILGVEVGQNSRTKGTLYNYLKSFRDMLLILNEGNEEELSTWGFDVVVSSSHSPRPQTATPPVEEM